MATENPVLQLLVTSGNQSLLAAGSRPDALANGQLGIFNFHTGLSVDGTVAQDCRDTVIMVGINRTSGGTAAAEDVMKSAGQMIQSPRVKAFTIKGANDEIGKVIEISGYTTLCNTDYLLNIEFRNRKNYGQNGYNSLLKPFSYHTSNCALPNCDSCSQIGDPIELAQALVDRVNGDSDKILVAALFVNVAGATVGGASANGNLIVTLGAESFTVPVLSGDSGTTVAAKIASAIATTSTSAYYATSSGAVLSAFAKKSGTVPVITLTSAGGTSVAFTSPTNVTSTISNSATFKAANPGVAPIIRLTANIEARPAANGSLNLKYYKSGMDFYVSGLFGFEANITVTTTVNLKYAEGSGYDLRELEYIAGGFNGRPGVYRQYADGIQKDSFEYFTTIGAKYTTLELAYDMKSVGGWEEYENNLETIIAIPCADSTTLSSLTGVTDLMFAQFGVMSNDISNISCTTARTGTFLPAADGIETLG